MVIIFETRFEKEHDKEGFCGSYKNSPIHVEPVITIIFH